MKVNYIHIKVLTLLYLEIIFNNRITMNLDSIIEIKSKSKIDIAE